MASSKLLDVSSLMRQSANARPGALPGVHARKAAEPPPEEQPAAEEVTEEAPAEPEAPSESPAPEADQGDDAPGEPETAGSETAETVAVEEPKKTARAKPAAKKTSTPRKRGSAATKKAAPAKTSEKEEPAQETESEPEELVSLDGRPARLWDVSDGKDLPEGWARIALERVQKANRHFRADRRNTTLPDNIYSACNDFIYQEGKRGGLDLTLSNLAEAAYEQIPNDDSAGITRLLDSLPDSYFEKGLQTRPRTFQLYEPTLDHMANLARMLRALGFTGKTGLVQTAALRQLLLDLDVTIAE